MSEALPPLLKRTADILADSARLLLEIEDSIVPLLTRPSQGGGAGLVETCSSGVVSLQKIDLLCQTLEDLSFWLEDLAREASHQVVGSVATDSAMTRLRLADLRMRLTGQLRPLEPDIRSEPLLF
jgi:hypothetical protein